METSPSIKEIAGALCKFQHEVGVIAKTADNPFFKSKYADLADMQAEIKEPMFTNGLSYVQFPIGEHDLVTMLMHISGEWIKGSYTMKPVKNDPQGKGSSITYQKRYALGAVLGLSTDEDDDGNAASGNVAKKASKPAAKAEGTWKPKPKETTQMDAATEVFSNNPLIGSIWTMDNGNYATCFKSPKSGKVCYAEYETQTCNRESFVKYLNDFEFDSLKREKLA